MEFAERFGASVDVSTTAGDVGFFLVRRYPSVDHGRFRATVAAAVGGQEYIQLDSPDGFVIVLTQYGTAEALRTRPTVEHVGGVVIDPERFPTPEIVVDDQSGDER
ncbi:hypothetical protein [Salinigranum sp. GCM10025319]|uniref:hypothetical protein n=1 Tax=Salinigranum sp. GCM10025319 TaxID=3252687 RepID=UPI0036231377